MNAQEKNDSTKYYLEFLCQKYVPQQPRESNNLSRAEVQRQVNHTPSTISARKLLINSVETGRKRLKSKGNK